MSHATTIYALASAPGRAGVSVFRISGPGGPAALRSLGVEKLLIPRMATLVKLATPVTCLLSPVTPIDSALALYFPAPHSFTGEDVIELHTHGSRAVTKLLLEALASIGGLRMAEPGEFARRAFLHGKLDLAQAEGLADLIDAETASQHQQAMRQMGGQTSQMLEAARMGILEPLALMEAYIDFPDEEIPESVIRESSENVARLKARLAGWLNDNGVGEKIRMGLEIVIMGAPNAGKSSLLNALARRDAAIVSPEAGTTRDLIEVPMEIGGYAVTLVDTAGLRHEAGAIESEGIRRAMHRGQHADIVLHLHDIMSDAPPPEMTGQEGILVLTKSDLSPTVYTPSSVIAISTKTGDGIDRLIAALKEKIADKMESSVASPLITRARHREAISEALACLERFDPHAPLELALEELRHAAANIGKITGKIWVDDILDLVFSRFCIGK